jgi:pyruvate carboxylase
VRPRCARAPVGYTHAGTVEFLMDADTGKFYFIEVNPRIQVEHTVTEQVTGIDIVKAQIRVTEGRAHRRCGLPGAGAAGHPLKRPRAAVPRHHRRPENGFTPDYGRITAYRSAAGFGIRLDGGTAYSGAVITPYYDSLLVKVTPGRRPPTSGDPAHGPRAARVPHPRRGDQPAVPRERHQPSAVRSRRVHHALHRRNARAVPFRAARPRHAPAAFLGDVTVNGNPDMKGRIKPDLPPQPMRPAARACDRAAPPPAPATGSRSWAPRSSRSGCSSSRVLLTDTTMRDAHQSLFATRMRTPRHAAHRAVLRAHAAQLFSLECWGGATFDVALRFLKEDPWERLRAARRCRTCCSRCCCAAPTRSATPTTPTTSCATSCSRRPRRHRLFRVFDSLNWVDNMRVAIDAVIETGALCEGAICYTGDLFDGRRKYDLKYYVAWRATGEGRRAHARHQGHGRRLPAARRARAGWSRR